MSLLRIGISSLRSSSYPGKTLWFLSNSSAVTRAERNRIDARPNTLFISPSPRFTSPRSFLTVSNASSTCSGDRIATRPLVPPTKPVAHYRTWSIRARRVPRRLPLRPVPACRRRADQRPPGVPSCSVQTRSRGRMHTRAFYLWRWCSVTSATTKVRHISLLGKSCSRGEKRVNTFV